ncbi:hypothetical protein [Moorena producens]|uniref:hypothetical protein n=1 Tax=Moorena producens TaxID=1155739 RepID=UPI003C76450F
MGIGNWQWVPWLVGIAQVNSGRIGGWKLAMPTLQNACKAPMPTGQDKRRHYKMRSRSGSIRVAWPFGQGASRPA